MTPQYFRPAYPRIADLPPPGDARRRILLDAGIRIHLSDFTDEERMHRWLLGPSTKVDVDKP